MTTPVSLFPTCIVDSLYPEVGEAVVDVLERLNVSVDLPEGQTCCGLPLYNNGYHDEARAVAARTIAAMAGEQTIVVPSGSCAWMMRKIYPKLLGEVGEAFAARVREFSEFVAAECVTKDATPRFRLPQVKTCTYHASCHLLRGLHLPEPPRALLAATEQLDVRPLEQAEECCGFGGTFSVRYDQVSTKMMDDKLAHARATGAETLVVTDPGCMLHLDGGARRQGGIRVRHLAEVLAEAELVGEPEADAGKGVE